MVQDVRIIDTVDAVQTARGVFFSGILIASGFAGLTIVLAGGHPGIALVVAVALIVVFAFACRRWPRLVWIVGLIQALAMAAAAFYLVSRFADGVWAAIAAAVAAGIMIIATRIVARGR